MALKLDRWWPTPAQIRASMKAPAGKGSGAHGQRLLSTACAQPRQGSNPQPDSTWTRADPCPVLQIHDSAALAGLDPDAEVSLYTDGSYSRIDGMAGAWALVSGGQVLIAASAHLGLNGSSSIAEIRTAALALRSIPPALQVLVRTDLLALVDMLNGGAPSAAGMEDFLRGTARHVRVRASWVPGHRGHAYNEMVDTMARRARVAGYQGIGPG